MEYFIVYFIIVFSALVSCAFLKDIIGLYIKEYQRKKNRCRS